MTAELTRRGSRADDLVQTRGRGGRAAKAASERTASGPPTGVQARTVAAGIREEPRVDLLPLEVKASRRYDAVARRLVLALGIVIVVVAAGIVACTVVAAQANASLSAAQAETQF